MRQITNDSTNAFIANRSFNKSNTAVEVQDNTTLLTLFGHAIAKKKDGITSITNAGYFTNTTKERLNGIPGVTVCQRKGVWYLNGDEWNGKWKAIN